MAKARKQGIFRPAKPGITSYDDNLKVADFSYQNDALAQLIVDAWIDESFRDSLLERRMAR